MRPMRPCAWLLWTLALLVLVLPGTATPARATPEDVVRSFYDDYMHGPADAENWVQALMALQKGHVEPELHDMLVEIAGRDPRTSDACLDFDPFSNSQMGTSSFTVRAATLKGGLAYVPVGLVLHRDTGPEKVRVYVVLRPHGSDWKIANFVYPAEAGMESWDLKSFLKKSLGK